VPTGTIEKADGSLGMNCDFKSLYRAAHAPKFAR